MIEKALYELEVRRIVGRPDVTETVRLRFIGVNNAEGKTLWGPEVLGLGTTLTHLSIDQIASLAEVTE